jgi:quercetin dioxygenase-like cupin family protein
MKTYETSALAAGATAAQPTRPATLIMHDSPDARLVLFRLEPGQAVAPHRNASTVILTVLAGTGTVSGPDSERTVRPGDVVTYDPDELHGMRSDAERFVLLATIAPRPGAR